MNERVTKEAMVRYCLSKADDAHPSTTLHLAVVALAAAGHAMLAYGGGPFPPVPLP